MPKVGSSLVDIPVTVNREKVFIAVDFRKGQLMSVVVARSPSALPTKPTTSVLLDLPAESFEDAWVAPVS
jgi:hypothetical protein